MTGPGLLLGLAVSTHEPGAITARVQAAERHGLNFVLFDDGSGAPAGPTAAGGLDPLECAAYAGAVTESIGLVATAAATHAEPYHLSNRFSSLDWGSRGRTGWLVTVDASPARAAAYSTVAPDAGPARREADAVLDAARRLWDSWEDGALIADSATGRFLDSARLHYVDAGGEFFRIRGPALMPRPVQGQVLVLARAADGIVDPDVALVDDGTPAGPGRDTDRARAGGAARVLAEIAVTADTDVLATVRRLAGEVDGVVLHPDRVDAVLEHLRARVPPALRADGVLAPPRPGQTLRDQLRLPRPPGRYATATTPPTAAGTDPRGRS